MLTPTGSMQGWPAVAALVLPAACAGAESVGDVMDALQERMDSDLTPLHLAVRSGSADLVRHAMSFAKVAAFALRPQSWSLTTSLCNS